MNWIPLCWHRTGFILEQLDDEILTGDTSRTCGLILGVGMAL